MTRFYSFFADDWFAYSPKERTPRKEYHHVKTLQPFDSTTEAVEFARVLIDRWRCKSIRITDGINFKQTVNKEVE